MLMRGTLICLWPVYEPTHRILAVYARIGFLDKTREGERAAKSVVVCMVLPRQSVRETN